MPLHSIYQKNIQALHSVDIVLATKVIQAAMGKSFELSAVSEKHHLYNIVDRLQDKAVYTNLIDELQEHLQELLPKSQEPFIYLFGIGNGYALPTLLENKNHKRIVIVEPELELLFVTLHLYDCSLAISSGRLRLFHQKSLYFTQAVLLFKEHKAKHFLRTFSLLTTARFYKEHFSSQIKQTHALLIDALSYVISSEAKNFSESLKYLENHLLNTPMMLNHTPLMHLCDAATAGGCALLIADVPSKADLELLRSLRPYVTLISSQKALKALHKQKIQPDIVTAMKYEAALWKGIPKKVEKELLLILPSQQEHLQLQASAANIIIANEEKLNPYFGLKNFGRIQSHQDDMHLAYEVSFLLKHTNTILLGDCLASDLAAEEDTMLKHYSYMSGLYKDKMSTYTTADTKLLPFHTPIQTIPRFIEGILHQKRLKKPLTEPPIEQKFIQSTMARQRMKITDLTQASYALAQKLQESNADFRPWFEALEGLEKEEILSYYSEDQLSVLLDLLSSIKHTIDQTAIYQGFFYDFLHPSMLLLYIEKSAIKSRKSETSLEKREKALEWAIINYQWLTQLLDCVTLSLDLLLKHKG